ncbi:MAG: hypothetical protein QXG00_07740 [Candidatus Woesearchaeota archaeon]
MQRGKLNISSFPVTPQKPGYKINAYAQFTISFILTNDRKNCLGRNNNKQEIKIFN